MRSINILPEDLISKIAAGEVIERPVSVVKELLENSIDAGADRISIRLEKGGKRLIKIIDNGVGMSKEDLRLCVKRYATSKISSIDDLFNIRTLGFRGEAIPSIAAVSKLRITSKPHDQLIGHRIELEGGKFVSLEEVGAPSGTIVEVRDLFFNIPARRKFLKSDRVEMDRIVDTVIRLSLCNLSIGISLKHGNKMLFNLPVSDGFISRFSLLFGEEVAEYMQEKKGISEDMVITAYLTLPEASRPKVDRLFFYVNGRAIKSNLIMKALMDAYAERLIKGEYPQGAVFVDIDPKRVDFNVHPTKQEVRFQDEGRIYRAVFLCIKEMLHPLHPYLDPIANEGKMVSAEEGGQYGIPQLETPRVIGQLRSSYIICESRDGLLLVDQHAAHERILYEKLKGEVLNRKMPSQRLLEPYRIELKPMDADNLEEKRKMLLDLGIEIEPFGGNTFLLTSYPPILKRINWASFIEEILKDDSGNEIDSLLKEMACHAAVRAGEALSNEEMEALLEELYKTELPTNCPHGRPTLKQITYYELEKMFKRVV